MRNSELCVGHHAAQSLLNELKFGDWASELSPLRRVLDGSLIRASSAPSSQTMACDWRRTAARIAVAASGDGAVPAADRA